MANDDDLSGLIDEASAEVDNAIEKTLKAKPRRREKGRYKPLLPLILIILSYVLYAGQQPEIPDAEVVASELTDLLRLARDSVESATVHGQRPLILPNAALGAIVNYTRLPGGYFLSVQSHGVVAEMDDSGRLTINGLD